MKKSSDHSLTMPMCAFFPWLYIREALKLREFILAPYEPGQALCDDETSNRNIEAILRPYESGGRPIGSATLVRLPDSSWTADLTDENRSALFVLSEITATCGLSAREFFGVAAIDYQNRDNFRLVVQSFSEDPKDGAAIKTRKRDGNTTNFWPGDSYRVRKPEHVHLGRNSIDIPLLNALLDLRTSDQWDRIYESVLNFNLANTDNSEFSEHVEAILLTSAFERLLDCRSGKEDDLAKAVTEILRPEEDISTDSCTLFQSPGHDSLRRRATLREAWIRDFFRLRGTLAHGQIESRYSSVWILRAHLLLASYAFPLALKRDLTNLGAYSWDERDQERLDVFERLLCEDLFKPVGDPHLHNSWPWPRIRTDFRRDRRVKKAVAAFLRDNPEAASGESTAE